MAERTLCIIKPDAVGAPWMDNLQAKNEEEEEGAPPFVPVQEVRAADKSDEILARLTKEGFKVVDRRLMQLTKAQAQAFYAEHAHREFFGTLCDFMSSGLSLVLVLEKENAIAELRKLMGPTNSAAAFAASEEAHPLNEALWSLRALFGTDGTRNAVHGSDSAYSAARETEFFFPAHATYEQTVALIKPDAVKAGATDAIIAELEANGFVVVARRSETLGYWRANEFYKEHEEKPFFDDLMKFMLSGETEALLLERHGAIMGWRLMMGPTNSETAKASAPKSIRARFGTDGTRNAVHGSDSVESAARERAFWFPEALPVERTLALIKPGAADTSATAIKLDIAAHGFDVLAERRLTMSTEQAEAFYEEHRGKPFFGQLCRYMSSGPVVALVLSKPAAIKCWRALMGPTDSEAARLQAPKSIRARFGTDGTRNAVHGSDSAASAAREVRFFFPHFRATALRTGAQAREMITKQEVATVFTPMGAVPKTLYDVLVEGLTQLCKDKPAGLSAVEQLGQWLIDNNPRQGRVAEADVGPSVVVAAPAPAGGAGGEEGELEEAEVVETKVDAAASDGLAGVPAPASKVVFVVGAPGAGKREQCERIAKQFGYAHISCGDLLRAEVAADSGVGKQIKDTLAKGALVSDDIALGVVKIAMGKSGGRRVLVEGFPRTIEQAVAFETAVKAPSFLLNVDLDQAEGSKRCLARKSLPSDNAAGFAARFDAYSSKTSQVVDFYGKLGRLRSVDAAGAEADVTAKVASFFEPHIVFVLGAPGSGKSRVCAAVAERHGYSILNVEALQRAEVSSGSDLGRSIAQVLADPALPAVSNDVNIELLRRAMEAQPDGRFLLDGYPRTAAQADEFRASLGDAAFVLSLECPAEVAKARALAAAGSADDIERRSRIYDKGSSDVIASYAKRGIVRSVDTGASEARAIAGALKAAAPKIVFVLGGPGSGKGTQCAKLVAEFGYTHLSAGDLLRAEVARGSSHGNMINGMIQRGQIVPVEITLGLLRAAMLASGNDRFLIDGFPRAMDQARAFERDVGECDFVLFFDVDDKTLTERLLHRGKTSGRVDDNAASIAKRLKTYHSQSKPVVLGYAASGKVKKITATGSPDEVFEATKAAIASAEPKEDGFVPELVVLAGASGSGRGEFAKRAGLELGYHHLRAQALLNDEAAAGTAEGAAIAAAMAAGRTAPLDATFKVLRRAINASPARRFLLDGFPRLVSDGHPNVHDQVFALEKALGPVRVAVCLDAGLEARKVRVGGTPTVGDEAALLRSVDTYNREKLPVVRFFEKRGTALYVDSNGRSADEVFAFAREALA